MSSITNVEGFEKESSHRLTRSQRAKRHTEVTKDPTSHSDNNNKLVSDLFNTNTTTTMANKGNANPPPSTPMESMMKGLSDKFDSFQNNIKTIDDNISGLRKEISENQTQTNTKLDQLTERNKVLENKLKNAINRIETLENLYYDTYVKNDIDQKNKQAMNIIIRGVPEAANEQLHVIMTELLDLVGSITYVQTNGAQRLGRENQNSPQNNTQRPRPIKLRCATTLQKGEIFRALKKIHSKEKFKNVSLSNEANKEDLIIRKEVQMLYNEAITKPNVQAKMRGNKIEIDGRTYDRSSFDNLPHGITRQSAATVITTNEVAFQGHCSPYSNLSLVSFTDNTYNYCCVEQRLGYLKATTCEDDVKSWTVTGI